jgi:hypothetical protein
MARQQKTYPIVVDMPAVVELLPTQRSDQPVPIDTIHSVRAKLRALVEWSGRWWLRPGPTGAQGKTEALKRKMAERGPDYPGERPHKAWMEEFGAVRERTYYRAFRAHQKER